MPLSLIDAAQLVNRSYSTIKRWKRRGCNVHDETAVLLFSDRQDIKARGASRKPYLCREDHDTTLATYFVSASPDDFIDLPCPIPVDDLASALETFETLRKGFQQRVTQLKRIGHKQSL